MTSKQKVDKTNCCVYGCHTSRMKEKSISFHLFPRKGRGSVHFETVFGTKIKVDRRKAWELALKMNKPATNYMRVCGKHFTKDDYLYGSSKKPTLKKTVVPSKQLPKQSSTKKANTGVREKCLQMRKLPKEDAAHMTGASTTLPSVSEIVNKMHPGCRILLKLKAVPNVFHFPKHTKKENDTQEVLGRFKPKRIKIKPVEKINLDLLETNMTDLKPIEEIYLNDVDINNVPTKSAETNMTDLKPIEEIYLNDVDINNIPTESAETNTESRELTEEIHLDPFEVPLKSKETKEMISRGTQTSIQKYQYHELIQKVRALEHAIRRRESKISSLQEIIDGFKKNYSSDITSDIVVKNEFEEY